MRELKVIERVTGARIARRNVPTIAEAEEAETQLMVERVLDAVAAGKGARFRGAMESLLNDYDGAELAAAALSLSVPERGGTASRDRADFLPSRERPAGRPHPKRHDQETGLGRSTYLKPMPYKGGPRRGRKNRPRD
jgi:ATP-dependent RNA helicase DeaD